MRNQRATSCSAQRGAAALVVVMVLFFIISLVAAYASRNMIFEQKTSANQYRSTAAMEAASRPLWFDELATYYISGAPTAAAICP